VTRKLKDLVDLEGLDAESIERLQAAHDLLVAAGPPPVLTPALIAAPREKVAPLRRRHRVLAGLAFAAALAALSFGGGYLLGHHGQRGMNTVAVVGMQGGQNALASVRIGRAESNGNWPIEFSVSGLPKLGSEQDFYILMLEQNGKPRYPCGWFRVANGTTTVHFTVPYKITGSSRMVVTSMAPGLHFPGRVVMTTV
jgi:hypothetical protein